jgi:hypothetical protein
MMSLSSNGNMDDICGIALSDKSVQGARGGRHIFRSAEGKGSLEDTSGLVSTEATFAQLKTRRPSCFCAKNNRVGRPKQVASELGHGTADIHEGLQLKE